MVADSREGACATRKEGSTTGEMTHGEEKKTEGSTSSSSDSDVKVMRKRKHILIESESSSDEKFEDWNDQTEETCAKMMKKKTRSALLSKAFHYTSVQNVRTPVKAKGKLIPTWHNAMVCQNLNALFAIS